MSSFLLHFFVDTFMCQAYEVKAKILLAELNTDSDARYCNFDPKKMFVTYATCAKIYAHVSPFNWFYLFYFK